FVRPGRGEPYFLPALPHEQVAQGERIMRMFLDTGAAITAEDLGTVPDYVRESLGRLGLPGYLIQRWEREWEQPGQPYKDPASWVENAVATTGTHDTETVAEWWEAMPDDERRVASEVPAVRHALDGQVPPTLTPAARDAILASLYESRSNLVILPFQDLFGWHDRINTPATVGDRNWRWALPWPVDRLQSVPVAADRAAALLALAQRTGRF
ncbi:MAG: 4-alpha-glucanotransferase, partial [Acidobacteriota bacterium]|nr:4-alpha-glucanotransferase [Acidobacteriota bacterium]